MEEVKNVKVEMIDQDETVVAVIQSAISESDDPKLRGRCHGVVIHGPRSDGGGLSGTVADDASKVINPLRETLRAKLGRKPSSYEIVSELPNADKRFRLA